MFKRKFYVANWKENKTFTQGVESFIALLKLMRDHPAEGREVIICPAYPLLARFKDEIRIHKVLGLHLGAQDVSRFEVGSYTGEVSALVLRELVEYVIIGHSERRKYFGETTAHVNEKISLCQKFGLTPIVCVGGETEMAALPAGSLKKGFLAFEDPKSIGSRQPQTVLAVKVFSQKAHEKLGNLLGFLYGGSVGEENAMIYLAEPEIDGILIGGESLDPSVFFRTLCKS